MNSIKDLIYFDVDKARSIISQLNGGLISEISRAFEDENEVSSGIGFDVKVVKGNVGGKNKEKILKTEKIDLYHELLNEVEKQLINNQSLSNINHCFDIWNGSFNEFMEVIPNMNYIKATGWGMFEDFERLKKIFSNYNEVQRLIFGSQIDNNPDVIALKLQLKEAKKAVLSNENRNTKAKELSKVVAIEKKLDTILDSETSAYLLDDDYITRIKIFLDTFSPKRLNFRLLPLEDFNSFQILSNLKSEYIVDGNLDSIIYTYGTRPNVKLTVLGIITSAPRENDIRVDSKDEYLIYDDNELSGVQIFDRAFRGVFTSFEEFEKIFFTPSYPKIALSPIAIYREVILNNR
ncbi:DUF6414 family protein [Pontibacter virosus]|uniref:Uncharacterized protein n=1 Tax=Pontibacter virosus TaxID=1765052 RepID=A0A2U1AY27_9BACT|nr:hypothetical protein [Pontibacter virosus]PVY41344.1 hypothetical protein C8E01_105273 [Pontibacter virosus]